MDLNIGGSIGADASYSEGVASNAINVTKNTTVGKKATETKPKQLRYPANMQIEKNTDYLKIEMYDYKPPEYGNIADILQSLGNLKDNASNEDKAKLITNSLLSTSAQGTQGSEKNKKVKTGPTIFLPIPQNLSDTNSVGWGPDSLDPLSAFGVSAANAIIDRGTEGVQKLIKKIEETSKVNGNNISENTRKAATAAISAAFVNALGSNVSTTGLISRATGQIFNPNLELLFEGVNLRAFPFTFDLAPRNKTEGEVVRQIIRTFKSNMTAKKTGKSGGSTVFVEAPSVFEVSYMTGNKPHKFLNKFKQMALTDISLNYTGSGTYATYHDGTPVHIQMTLTFKELNPIYSEDYNDIPLAEGVGY